MSDLTTTPDDSRIEFTQAGSDDDMPLICHRATSAIPVTTQFGPRCARVVRPTVRPASSGSTSTVEATQQPDDDMTLTCHKPNSRTPHR